MATIAYQQSDHSVGTTTATINAFTPSATDSILWTIVCERSGNSHTNHTCSDNAGQGSYTKVGGHDQELADSGARQSVSIWWRRASATSAFDVSGGSTSGATVGLTIVEHTTDTDNGWSFEEFVANDSGTSGASPLDCGTTGAVAAGDLLPIAWASWRHASTTPTAIDFDGSFANQTIEGPVADNRFVHAFEWYQDSTGGTYNSEVSWSTATDAECTAGIVVFRLGTAAAGIASRRMMVGVGL